MADITDIDNELAKIKAEGGTPKNIYVGTELFSDLSAQQNEVFGDSFISVQRTSNNEVMEYKGIPVELKDGVPQGYLEIENTSELVCPVCCDIIYVNKCQCQLIHDSA